MVYPTEGVSFRRHEPFPCYESTPSQDFFDNLFMLEKSISQFQKAPNSELESEILKKITYLQRLANHPSIKAQNLINFDLAVQRFERTRKEFYVNSKKLKEDLRVLKGISFSLSEANQLISSARTASPEGLARALKSCEDLFRRIHQVFQRTQRPHFLSESDRKILEKIRKAEPVIANTKEILKRMLQQEQNRIITEKVASLEKRSLKACICRLTKKVQRCFKDKNTSSLSKIEQDFLMIKQKISKFSHERELGGQFTYLSQLVDRLKEKISLLEKRNRENQPLKREIHSLMEHIWEIEGKWKENMENIASFPEIEKHFTRIEKQMKTLGYPFELRRSFEKLCSRFYTLNSIYDKNLLILRRERAEKKADSDF